MSPTLRNLGTVPLHPVQERSLAQLDRGNVGAAYWRRRKLSEASDLLRLATICPKLHCVELDLGDELRGLFHLDVAVATQQDGKVAIRSGSLVGISYSASSLLPNGGPPRVTVLHPLGLWHPNVLPAQPQLLCLGALPAGIRAVELLLLTYRALAMQDFMLDERDPAGVLHLEAARYWQQRMNDLPLTAEPFLTAKERNR